MFLLSYNIKKLKILIAELPELSEGQIKPNCRQWLAEPNIFKYHDKQDLKASSQNLLENPPKKKTILEYPQSKKTNKLIQPIYGLTKIMKLIFTKECFYFQKLSDMFACPFGSSGGSALSLARM